MLVGIAIESSVNALVFWTSALTDLLMLKWICYRSNLISDNFDLT